MMIDETKALSKQMIFCLCYVDNDLLVHDEVIGLYCLEFAPWCCLLAIVCVRLNLVKALGQVDFGQEYGIFHLV